MQEVNNFEQIFYCQKQTENDAYNKLEYTQQKIFYFKQKRKIMKF